MTWKIYQQPGELATSSPRRVAVVEANSKGNALSVFGATSLETRARAVGMALVNVERGSRRMELEIEFQNGRRGHATRFVAQRVGKRTYA